MPAKNPYLFIIDSFKSIKRVAFPLSVPSMLGRIFGALSLIALFKHASAIGLSATFSIILDIYEVALRNTVGLLDPAVISLINWLKNTLAIHLPFFVGWRHIFLILQILFIRDAGTAFSDGRRLLGIVRLIVGIIVAFSTSVFAFMANGTNPLIANAVLCTIPIFGLFIYDIIMYAFSAMFFFDAVGLGEMKEGQTQYDFFITGLKRSMIRFMLVACGSLLIFVFPSIRSTGFPLGGLIAMMVGLIANATYWIIMGGMYALQQKRIGMDFQTAFFESESGRFGLSVLGILFWFTVFCSLNAGMRLLGF